LPEELGRGVQIDETAKVVAVAIADAAIADPQDVHFVQIKCPLLTSDRIEAASARGCKTVTESAYGSMAYSRGASALGVAVALGDIRDEQVLRNFDLFSSVASTSAGIELMHNVVIVLGNSISSASPFEIGHAVMRDSIDSSAVLDALKSGGLGIGDGSEPKASRRQLVNIFAKAEASRNGNVRGYRHTMLDDSDVGATRHARAAVGGLIGGLSETGAVYVSGGAEHQGPPGGGPVAANRPAMNKKILLRTERLDVPTVSEIVHSRRRQLFEAAFAILAKSSLPGRTGKREATDALPFPYSHRRKVKS
jgi:cyanuric acid amidohydrolase